MSSIMSVEEHLKYVKKKKKDDKSDSNTVLPIVNSANNNQSRTLQQLRQESKVTKENYNKAQSSLRSYLEDNEVTPGNNIYSAPNPFTIRKNQLDESLKSSGKSLLVQNKGKSVGELPFLEQQNMNKYKKIASENEGKNLVENVKKTRNENALAESNYEYQEGVERYKNGNKFDRAMTVLSSPVRKALGMLNLDNKRVYDDPNSKTSYILPSYMEGIDSGINQYGSGFAKTVNEVGGQIGKTGASALLNTILPGLGTTAYNVDMFTNTYNQALREGYNNTQATSYATLSTAVEFATGKLLGAAVGKFQKMGDFENTISKALKKVIPNEKINRILSSALSEGTEEFLQEFIDVYTRNLTLGENNTVTEDTVKNALYSGLIGALSSGSSEGIRQLTKNSITSQTDQIVYNIEKANGNSLSETNKQKISNYVLEQYLANDGPVNPKDVVNSFIQDVDNRVNNLKESATKEKIDTEKASGLINSLNKLIKDKGYNITFDSSIGENVNGVNINGDVIKINPNSNRALEFIAMHEVTHSVSTDKMRKLVMDYTEKNPKLKDALESLKETYKTNDVSDEVLADISGQLFGNQEFINMLKNDEPSTFKKLYNGVISIANKLTGNSNEFLFVNDLKNKWENAYRNPDINKFNDYVYSIQQDDKGTKYVQIDTNQDIFIGKSIYEQTKIAKEYILDNFREKGLSIANDNIQVTSRTANEYTHPRNPLPVNTKSSKMKASTELNNLLTISKYLYSRQDDGRHSFAKDGWEYYKTVFQVDNKTFEGIINIGKSGNKKTLYDITNIKRIDQNRGTSANAFSASLVNSNASNISQNNDNVKSDTLSNNKYSIQENGNNTLWQAELENSLPSKGTKTYGKDISLPSRLPNQTTNQNNSETLKNEEITKEIPKSPTKESSYETKSVYEKESIQNLLEKRIRKERYKAINDATDTGNRFLDFTREEKLRFKEDLDKFVGLKREDLNDIKTYRQIEKIVENYANKELIFEDNDVKRVKKEIRNYRFKLSDSIQSEMTDFKDFRKNNFGKIIFSKEGDGIDTIYQELANTYPEYFDKDIYSESDMLYRIEAIVNQDSKIVDKYRIDQNSLAEATKSVVAKLQNGLMSEEDINNLQNEIEEKALARTREVVYKEYIDSMGITVDELDTGKDINMLDLSRTDPRRLFEKVFDKPVADKLNRELTEGVEHNEALKNNELTRLREEVKSLNIKVGSKESAAVQKYVEGHYMDEYGDYREYNDRTLMSEFPKVEDQEKIKNAAKWFKETYSILGDTYNNTLTDNGYKPMEMRKNYMPHFQEKGDILSKIGYPLSPQALSDDVLPTDINGLTDEFKPGKKYFSHEQRRTGERTVYDAIRGFDEYIEGWGNVVYHTEDIQKRRAIAKLVRDTWGPTNGTSNENFIGLTRPQQINRIEEIRKHKLSKFAAWIDEQANFIAGKKGKLDRALEGRIGRKIYTIMRAGKKQVGSNMVGLNVRSPLTNFASTIQAFSKTNPIDSINGYASTIVHAFKKDDLVSKSDFLTNRLNQSERLYTKLWDKASNMGQLFMGATDSITTNMIYRSKYSECLRKGMSEKEAIRTSDDFTARIMGNHTVGTTASIFNDQTLGILTQFQLEVNNYWSSIMHDNKMALKYDKTSLTNKVAGMVWQAGTLAGLSYVFNNAMKDLTGSDVMLDFVEMFKTIFVPDDDEEESNILDRSKKVFQDILNQLPFSSIFTGGRLPIGEAFKGFSTFFNFLTGQEDNYGNDITWKNVKDDALDSASYWILPSGKSQISKALKGSKMYDSKLPVAGSYTDSGNLRFTADTSNFGKAKAILFGQYSSKDAQDYIDSGYKSISASKVQEMKDLGMNSTEYRKLRKELTEAIKTTDSNGYDKYTDNSNNTYYYDKKTGIVYDSKYSKVDKSVTLLNKANKSDLKFNYISNLDMSEANKKILFKNEFKTSTTDSYGYDKYLDKKGDTYWYDSNSGVIYNSKYKDVSNKVNINNLKKYEGKDFSDYGNYSSYEEFSYASQHPEKYEVIKQISSYDDYQKYKDKIEEIKSGNEKSTVKKEKVIKYVNSLKLNIPQKAMLIRMYYTSFNTYNKNIVEYVQKQKISKSDKETILTGVGFKIKQGRVYYK